MRTFCENCGSRMSEDYHERLCPMCALDAFRQECKTQSSALDLMQGNLMLVSFDVYISKVRAARKLRDYKFHGTSAAIVSSTLSMPQHARACKLAIENS